MSIRVLPKLACALPALSLVCAVPSLAAQVTDVADAADGDDPFDANIEVKYDFTWHRALITRENTQVPADDVTGDPRTVEVRELDYNRYRHRVKPRIEVGIFHDLSAFLEWPIVIWDEQSTEFTDGTTNRNSTITRDMGKTPTINGWPETCGNGRDGLTEEGGQACYGYPHKGYTEWRVNPQDGTYKSVRAGFDYPQIGLRWSPVNNERDLSKPTITLQADYNLGFLPLPIANPTPPIDGRPGDAATQENPGPVAKGVHEFHFQVAMSKRWLLLDPFFVVDYWAPFSTSDAYTGLFPRHRGGFTLGMEIVPYENPQLAQKFAIQLSGLAQYIGPGRDYNELSDMLGELNYTDNYMRTGLNLGFYFKAFEFGYLNVVASAMYDSPHLATVEKIGDDHDAEGEAGYGTVDLDLTRNGQPIPQDQIERNVYFNPAIDTPGQRFKIDESLRVQVMAHVALTF